jgi:trans-2,3-dihydro-3-hydroxyanthranilate isomerase
MASHPFRIVNVFTEAAPGADSPGPSALTGNPLCVFENGAGLTTEVMQNLARQFNLSETTFILPSTRAVARVRIFTPNYEMPFAGHPTLGSAHVCRALQLGGDLLVLETEAGLIPVSAEGGRWTLTALPPTWREPAMSRGELARALGLEESDIGDRPLWVKAGKEQLIVPLTSADAVRRTNPAAAALSKLVSEDGRSMAYVFAFTGSDTVLSRFFFPQNAAYLEDPATGSATANFGGWCVATQRPQPLKLKISQGAMVKRPSTLYLEVIADQIFVGGDVIEIGRGSVEI